MTTKINQYYLTIYFKDSPIYTIFHPFINFKKACNIGQKIVEKSGKNWSFTATKPKYYLTN